MRLRISILQQSAVSETRDSSSGDEKEDDADLARRRGSSSSSPAAVTAKLIAMFEARDRAGTGTATVEVLQGVLEEVKENLALVTALKDMAYGRGQ